MANTMILPCDGCGQYATLEHLGRRLQRLEWSTRFRPVHIQTLLLGSVSPKDDRDFLYSPKGEFRGEAALLLEAMGISAAGKNAEAVHAEVQRAGLFVTHVLECPLENGAEQSGALSLLLVQRAEAAKTRIRRSLKPKRVVLISGTSQELVTRITADRVGCSVILDSGKPFALDGPEPEKAAARLREALAGGPTG